MRKRAEQRDEVRQRIVDAAVELHGSIGPAYTTISAIAEEAGVTRMTVYRHFAVEEAIFAACSAHWLTGQTPPDPSRWVGLTDPEQRLRAALSDVYRFYRDGAEMLTRIYRDRDSIPPRHQAQLAARDASLRDLLLTGLPRGKRVRAAVALALSFATWQVLCLDQGLSTKDAVDVMVAAVLAA
jgi:AcrR family transcriptional regulator